MKKRTEQLTSRENFVVEMMRYNQATPKLEIRKKWTIGRLQIVFEWRSKKNLWGRFGGGWNWKFGVTVGSTTLILDLLVFSLRFDLQGRRPTAM